MINRIAVTPDGRRAVSVGDDYKLQVWTLDGGHKLATFTADAPLEACTLSPEASMIVAGGVDGAVHVLSLDAAEQNYRLRSRL